MKKLFSIEELEELHDAKEVVKSLNVEGNFNLKLEDYLAWLGGDYETNDDSLMVENFDKAVIEFLGKEVYEEYDGLARLDCKLRYELGLGKRFIGGIDLK
jgi:hypothetical protein